MFRYSFLASFLLTLLLAVVNQSCTTGEGGVESDKTISLSADRGSIMADGVDSITFTVIDNSTWEDVTSNSTIYLVNAEGDQVLASSSFSTSEAGSFSFFAEYEGVFSSSISVTALAESAEGISLSASKTAIYSDGGDFTVLTLSDQDGNDVTELGTFYADGEQLEGNRFSTTKSSLTPVTISATFGSNNNRVENTVSVTASTTYYQFSSRALLEEITRTNCQYCPIMIEVISQLAADDPQVVVAYNVHNTLSSLYDNFSSTTQDFSLAFCDFMLPGEDGRYTNAPKSYVNRNPESYSAVSTLVYTFRDIAASGSKDVAIALWSELEGTSQLTVYSKIGSKKAFNGKAVAVLVDNGLSAYQTNVGYIQMYRVMRAYYPSVSGESVSFTGNAPVNFTATFDLSELKVTAAENCEVIVFVTDDEDGNCETVQFASIGEAKGY